MPGRSDFTSELREISRGETGEDSLEARPRAGRREISGTERALLVWLGSAHQVL